MSRVFVQVENFIRPDESTNIPDKLRGELGGYYSIDSLGAMVPLRYESNRILSSSISPAERNDQLLFPTHNHVINIYGKESEFRDQIQWREFVEQLCETGKAYESHSFILEQHQVTHNVTYNHHDFVYEENTKMYDTNLLLNYNLMNYRFNNETEQLKKMSLIKSIYDSPNTDAPNSEDTFRQLLFEYPERIQDYSGSVSVLDRKQRHIFDFQFAGVQSNKHGVPAGSMPFHFKATATNNTAMNSFLNTYMSRSHMSKFIMQSLKNNNIYRTLEYEDPSGIFEAPMYIKGHDLINILINYDFSNFTEGDDELFLHQEQSELNSNSSSNRFVNTMNRIKFLEDIRVLLKTKSQDYKEVINCNASEVFSVGWKVEKYYLNDQTVPVQTYHICKHGDLNNFFDTQLKYGDVYIYKITHLIAVLGNYYTYSDIHTSEDGLPEGLRGADGTIRSYGDHDVSKKYGARVKVSVAPSFYIMEIPAKETHITLNDRPTLPPEVVFFNESNKKNNINILLKTPDGEVYDSDYQFQRIGPNDEAVETRLINSRDNIYGTIFSNEHFTGIYEIYRLDTPPKSISDFENNLLVMIDQKASMLSTPMGSEGYRYNYTLEYPNASYEDVVLPHKKYYYLFRTLTYHGTPSNHSHIYELELMEDSDETKIVVKEYKIPEQKDYSYSKACKRLMRIVPNYEQLLFKNEFPSFDNSVLADIGIENTRIFNGMPTGKVFKIRITSKHTGKKMDINLRFKIRKSNF
jgi:hypothetical protein